VRDVAATLDELAAKGVRTEELRVDAATGKRMAFFFDPDDLPLELYEVRPRPSRDCRVNSTVAARNWSMESSGAT
jgi:hypothetical protein